jgi:large subunit ribosomal protein L19
MNIVQQLEAEQLAKLTANKRVDAFKAGDVVRVNVKIVEGNNERIQAFEGMVIARKNAGTNSSFTVRKMSHGEGVERIFPLFSPRLESVERVRGGTVRRAKLYYLRGRTGRAARIKERIELAPGAQAAAE